jgi:ABC-type branched-subunit amino acid transport system ATPase component
MNIALQLHGVGRNFGGLAALDDITMQVESGHCHGLIGPNGAGKSTLLNVVAGSLRPSAGRVLLDGRDITTMTAAHRARQGIARTFQHPAVFARLSVRDNLKLASHHDDGRVARLVTDAGLAEHAHTPAGQLPYGMQRNLELTMALALRPRLLLLDEPSAGLDPDEIARLVERIRSLAGEVTVLLVDHNLDLVWTLAKTITVLDHGRHLATGTPDHIRSHPEVREAYLTEGVRQTPPVRRHDHRPTLLRVRELSAGYRGAPVVHGIDLDVREGEAVAILGRNGAGKTTLLSAIAGLLPTRSPSRVELGGEPLPVRRPHHPPRAGLAIVPQGRRVFAPLTVTEHLVCARSSRTTAWTVERVLALLPALAARARHRANQLSGGEQQMLALARALVTGPRVLILDEPSEGLAPAVIDQLAMAISTLADEGISVLIAEQNLDLATAVADRVIVLDRGRTALAATTTSLTEPAQQQRLGALLGVAKPE